MEIAIAIALIAALGIANIWATWVVVRDPYSEKRQKVFQLAALWLLPVLGAIFVFALHRKPEPATRAYRQSLDSPWDDPPTSRHAGRTVHHPTDD